MKIGILADIHEAVEPLERALAAFRALGTERIVVLGDVLEMGERIDTVVGLLTQAGAAGVWGNHDFGLCREPPSWAREHFSSTTLEYFQGLVPRLEIDGCLFTHVAPYLDPENLEDLWSPGGFLSTPEAIERSFAATRHRILCMGHAHRWLLATPGGVKDWSGEGPVDLDREQRTLVSVHAVLWGWCALLDTGASRLVPVDVRGSGVGRGQPGPPGRGTG